MRKILFLLVIAISSFFLYSCATEESVNVTLYLEGNQLGNDLELSKGDKIIIPCATRDGYILDGWYTSLDNGETFDKKWIFDVDKVEDDLSLYAIWVPKE